MTAVLNSRTVEESALGDADFKRIASLAKSKIGIELHSSKKALIKSRLSKCLKRTGCSSFSKYCDLVERGDPHELQAFISALTTNVTQFFREYHHFEIIINRLTPEINRSLSLGKSIRIWSAGCSTGQEPYSIAAILLKYIPNVESKNIKILATDIDVEAIKFAMHGQYKASEVHVLKSEFRDILFPSVDNTSLLCDVSAAAKKLVVFQKLNLTTDWPMESKFDVVMCRNVSIYFDKSQQEELWHRMACQVQKGGYLFIGHSERLLGRGAHFFQNAGMTTYQRVK
jgi:chemotaxis protein methyltransferase CheR